MSEENFMECNAYVTTLSTESYLDGVLALDKSLKNVGARYPLYVVLNEEIPNKVEIQLKEKGIETLRRKKIELPEEIVNKNNSVGKDRWSYTFDKLNVFELTQFKKIVFLDSDIYVRKNIDDLFEKPHMSAVIDKRYGPHVTARFLKLTSGVIVIEPAKNQLEKFKEIIETIIDKRYAIGDQDILQEYDPDWENKRELHLKNRYNTFFPYLEYYMNFQEYSIDDFCVIHFIYPKKPWMIKSENRVENYIKYVNDFTEKDYKETGIPEMKDALYGKSENAKVIAKEYFNILDSIK